MGRILALLFVLAVAAAAAWVGYQRQLEGPIARVIGPEATRAGHTTRPVLFAATEVRIVPATAAAVEGWLVVPERRADAGRATLRIHYVHFPTTADDPAAPIVFLAGGPGQAATDVAAGPRFALFQQMRAVADVVVFDQRGTPYAEPRLDCPGAIDFPLDRQANAKERGDVAGAFLRACAAAWSRTVDLAAYNTRESASDLEDLRIALGVPRLNLWADGYGTQLALDFLRLYPGRVEGAVLAGVQAPHQVFKFPGDVDLVFDRVADAISADPRLGSVFFDPRADVGALLEHLQAAPERVLLEGIAGPVEVGRTDLETFLYARMATRAGIAAIPRDVGRMLAGDAREAARRAAAVRSNVLVSAMAVSVDCASGAGRERLEDVAAEAQAALLGDVANLSLRAQCAAWPAFDLGEDYRAPVESTVPVLFVSGSLDPVAPAEAAEEVLAGFTNGWRLLLEGAAHGDDLFLSSPYIAEITASFFRGLPPPVDTIVLTPIPFLAP